MRSVRDLMNLTGRVALITGGAGYIGATVGSALAELGATVVVLDLDRERCEEAAAAIATRHGVPTLALPTDLTDEAAVRSAPSAVTRRFGRLDIIVHVAALIGTTGVPGWAVPFEQQSIAAWDAALRVNLTSAFALVHEAREALAASGHGSVVLVSSIYGVVGPDMGLYEGTSMANPAGYAASKGGLIQLARYLATVLAPRIRVNALSPGGVLRGQPAAFRERYEARTPLRRMATEEDLKGAAVFLASDLSAYVTGQNLLVDGGWTAW